jgi:hypothetical protein
MLYFVQFTLQKHSTEKTHGSIPPANTASPRETDTRLSSSLPAQNKSSMAKLEARGFEMPGFTALEGPAVKAQAFDLGARLCFQPRIYFHM